MILATQLRLDELPLEKIHRIAAEGSCRSALSLAEANRKCRSICYDPLLFRKIVEKGNGKSSADSPAWWDRANAMDPNNTRLAAKWAFADELASEAIKDAGSRYASSNRTLDWLIPLLVAERKLSLCSLRDAA